MNADMQITRPTHRRKCYGNILFGFFFGAVKTKNTDILKIIKQIFLCMFISLKHTNAAGVSTRNMENATTQFCNACLVKKSGQSGLKSFATIMVKI
jgi:hypothetical protein